MKNTNGKRAILGAGLALALPFGLAACGDDEADDVDIVEEEEDAPTRGGEDLEDDSDTDD